MAEQCVKAGAHYLDLADARDFVAGIGQLDDDGRATAACWSTSGVSSTPAITSAMVAELAPEFAEIDEICTALSPAIRTRAAPRPSPPCSSYLGKKIRVWQDGKWVERPGWGDAQRLQFPPPVGLRRVYNCDVPELELFPRLLGPGRSAFPPGWS